MKKIIINNGMLRQIGREAQKLNIPAYLIGGAVRDLILRKKSLDFDIVVEGDPSKLVRKLAREWKSGVISHERFGTFVMTLRNGRHIDFATARKETYPAPGKLPVVKPSSLKEDVKRRDFTVNSMAVSLNKKDFGCLIDIAGGFDDLRKKELRVLHARSFRDDPTRILRLARFASRGFRVNPNTERLLLKNRKYLSKVSDERVSAEIFEILDEQKPALAFSFLKKWGLFESIFPGASYSKAVSKINKPKTVEKRFLLLADGMNQFQIRVFMDKFKLSRKLKEKIKNSLKNVSKLVIDGNDLIKMGYKPGPVFKKIFESLSKKRFSSRRKAKKFVFDNFP